MQLDFAPNSTCLEPRRKQSTLPTGHDIVLGGVRTNDLDVYLLMTGMSQGLSFEGTVSTLTTFVIDLEPSLSTNLSLTADGLRYQMPVVREFQDRAMQRALGNRLVHIGHNETSDAASRKVHEITVSIPGLWSDAGGCVTTLLLDLLEVDTVDTATVVRTLREACERNGVDPMNVRSVAMDSASHNVKAWTTVMGKVFPKAFPMFCIVHALNNGFVSLEFNEEFDAIKGLMQDLCSAAHDRSSPKLHNALRRALLDEAKERQLEELRSMEEVGFEGPRPWLKGYAMINELQAQRFAYVMFAVFWLSDNYDVVERVLVDLNKTKDLTARGVKVLEKMRKGIRTESSDIYSRASLKDGLSYITARLYPAVNLLRYLEDSQSTVFPFVVERLLELVESLDRPDKDFPSLSKAITEDFKATILEVTNRKADSEDYFFAAQWLTPQAFADALDECGGERGAAINKIESELIVFPSIKAMRDENRADLKDQIAIAIREAKKYSEWRDAQDARSSLDPVEFWMSKAEKISGTFRLKLVDELIALCLTPMSSADAERAHSKYRYLLTERRQSLTFDNMRDCALLYTNGKVLNLPQKFLEERRSLIKAEKGQKESD